MNKWMGLAVLGVVGLTGLWLGVQAWRTIEPSAAGHERTGVTETVRQAPATLPTPAAADAQPVQPPPRRLVGVIARGKQYSHALIADANTQEQKMYQVGAAVAPDNAELVAINADHVVLQGLGYGRIVLRLQAGDDEDLTDDLDPGSTYDTEASEIDRLLETVFGPDPYLECERYTAGAEEDACDQRIDAEIDRRVEACDDVEDKDAYADCLDRAQSLQ